MVWLLCMCCVLVWVFVCWFLILWFCVWVYLCAVVSCWLLGCFGVVFTLLILLFCFVCFVVDYLIWYLVIDLVTLCWGGLFGLFWCLSLMFAVFDLPICLVCFSVVGFVGLWVLFVYGCWLGILGLHLLVGLMGLVGCLIAIGLFDLLGFWVCVEWFVLLCLCLLGTCCWFVLTLVLSFTGVLIWVWFVCSCCGCFFLLLVFVVVFGRFAFLFVSLLYCVGWLPVWFCVVWGLLLGLFVWRAWFGLDCLLFFGCGLSGGLAITFVFGFAWLIAFVWCFGVLIGLINSYCL